MLDYAHVGMILFLHGHFNRRIPPFRRVPGARTRYRRLCPLFGVPLLGVLRWRRDGAFRLWHTSFQLDDYCGVGVELEPGYSYLTPTWTCSSLAAATA